MKIGRPEKWKNCNLKKKKGNIILFLSLKSCHSLLTQSPDPELTRANDLNKNA